MADIRINALATTAASTASDDFVAVDGSANGTRKLNAYSPTFGGNLTVSGGQVSIAALSSTPSVLITQTDSAQYSLFRLRNTGGTAQSYDFAVGGSGTGSLAQKFYIYDSTASAVRLAIAPTTGNFLIGGTTDGGQKLQVAGTAFIAASASSANILFLRNTASNGYSTIQFEDTAGNAKGYIGYGNSGTSLFSSQFYIAAAASIVLASGGGTTGLTLDSSQNATFAGTTVKISNAASPQLNFNNVGVRDWYAGVQTANDRLVFGTSVSSSGGHAIRIDSSLNVYVPNGELVLTNALKLGNAYTAGAPTATGYVTIKDSAGNTYKVLVGT